MKALKTMRWVMLISGILLVLLGIGMIFSPASNLLAIAIIIAVSVMGSGISEIVSYFGSDREDRSGWLLTEGILWTVLGLWLMLGSGVTALAAIIPYVFAVWVMASGVIRAVESFALRSNGVMGWGWLLAGGIICTALGVAMLFSPLFSAALVSTLAALLVIMSGVSNITMFITMKRMRDFIRRRRGDRG